MSTLIVARHLRDALTIVTMLDNRGFEVTVAAGAASFAMAKSRLYISPPAVLITNLRLGEFNGLHLALCARLSGQPWQRWWYRVSRTRPCKQKPKEWAQPSS